MRVNRPDLATALHGHIYLFRYREPVTLEHAVCVHEDYERACASASPPGEPPMPLSMVMLMDKPIPLPDAEVRKHWRARAQEDPGFGSIALVARSLNTMMISVVNQFARQLVAVLGVDIQVFWDAHSACAWLAQRDSTIDLDALVAAVHELEGLPGE